MARKGFTIVELIVSMAIFIVVVTLAIGAFVSVSRMKALTSVMKESQQKMRISLEMLTRLSRQAEGVIVDDDNQGFNLFFSTGTPDAYATRFQMVARQPGKYSLEMLDCKGAISGASCSSWGDPVDLTGGDLYFENGSVDTFVKQGSVPPHLNIDLRGKININNSAYYSDIMTVKTAVILENIR